MNRFLKIFYPVILTVAGLGCLLWVLFGVYMPLKKIADSPEIIKVHTDMLFTCSSYEDLDEHYDNIFIATVTSYDGRIEGAGTVTATNGEEKPMPYRQYSISVVANLKGEADNDDAIYFSGGRIEDNCWVVYNVNEQFPVVGTTYIFAVEKITTDSTFKDEGYLLYADWQKVELKNYDTNKALESQSSEIANVVDQVKTAISK